jgi:hypothetical protein
MAVTSSHVISNVLRNKLIPPYITYLVKNIQKML